MRTFLAIVLSLVGLVFTANAIDTTKLVDMTYAFAGDTLHWPTAKPFHLDKVAEGRTPQGYWYSSYNYGGSEHVGTHLDAPFHFAEGRWTTEQIPSKTIDRSRYRCEKQSGDRRDYLSPSMMFIPGRNGTEG
jgi:hypothetical protein